MEPCSTQKLASLCSGGPVALDVSPLLPLLNPTSCLNDTASVTEVLMHQLPDDTLFVADENAAAGHGYDMRTLFDEIEKSEIEGEPAEEATRVERGAKLLIDEFVKANPAVWNFFLDLLESRHFTDSQGAMHDLDGYTIVFTSNAPKEEVQEKFPPELLSRFGFKARFAPLSTEDKQAFVRRYIGNVATKYQCTRNMLPHPDDVANAALEGIDVSKEENIRVLKNEARKWFADYINECADR